MEDNRDEDERTTEYWLELFVKTELNIEDVGYLVITDNSQFNGEAVEKIKASWKRFAAEHSIDEP